MTKDEALKLALEALGHFEKAGLATLKTIDAIIAIREALRWTDKAAKVPDHVWAQPQRTWVGLTVEDKKEYLAQDFGGSRADAMDWAEQRLKEKNT